MRFTMDNADRAVFRYPGVTHDVRFGMREYGGPDSSAVDLHWIFGCIAVGDEFQKFWRIRGGYKDG